MHWITTGLVVLGLMVIVIGVVVITLAIKRYKNKLNKPTCRGVVFKTQETILLQPGSVGVAKIPCKGVDGSEMIVEICAMGLPNGEIVRIPKGTEMCAAPSFK